MNVAYNQGYYGGLVSSYSTLGETATAATVASVNSYSSVWGVQDTYQQYPYQVHYYLDQLYDNPIPTTSATTFSTPTNHVAFSIASLETVFSNVFQTMDYVNSSGSSVYISATQGTNSVQHRTDASRRRQHRDIGPKQRIGSRADLQCAGLCHRRPGKKPRYAIQRDDNFAIVRIKEHKKGPG